jgi:hypothetical protein
VRGGTCKRRSACGGGTLCRQHAARARACEPCAICYEAMTPRTSVGLAGCGHCFHDGCLREWCKFLEVGTCPLCRAAVRGEDCARAFRPLGERVLDLVSRRLPAYRQYTFWMETLAYAEGEVEEQRAQEEAERAWGGGGSIGIGIGSSTSSAFTPDDDGGGLDSF